MNLEGEHFRAESLECSRRVERLIAQIELLLNSTLAAAVLVERDTGRPYVMPHPHCTPQVMEMLAHIDWKQAMYVQQEFLPG